VPATEWNVGYANHQIRFVKTQSDGARLYVDSELLDTIGFWKTFLPLIVLPPAILYGLAVVVIWIRNGFRIARKVDNPPETMP
jgi:hypothetical protein